MMKAMLKILVLAVVVVSLVVMAEEAKALTFTLDGELVGNVFTSGGPYGSITLTDNGNNINFTALLNANAPYTIYRISLNWDTAQGGVIPASGTWSGGSGITIAAGTNGQGYNGWFDILVTSGVLGNPLSFTLSNSSFGDLNPSLFNTKDVNGLYYAVLRTEDLDPPIESSKYYASTVVPEPGILILLGICMTGVVGLRRWWRD